jgi:hypothetical protein
MNAQNKQQDTPQVVEHTYGNYLFPHLALMKDLSYRMAEEVVLFSDESNQPPTYFEKLKINLSLVNQSKLNKSFN